MMPVRELKTCFISLMILLSLLSVIIIIPEHVKAESYGETTLYFHDYLWDGTIDLTPPYKDNDSAWPPSTSNNDEWIEWFLIWLLYKEMLNEFNESELEEYEILLEELDVLNPFKITEYYEYDAEDLLQIKGDVTFNLYFSSTLPLKASSSILDVFSFFVPDEYYIEADEVKVNLDLNWGEKRYNKTSKINLKLLESNIQNIKVVIEDVDFELSEGDSLSFSVEVIQSDKPIKRFIEDNTDNEKLRSSLENFSEWLTNESKAKLPKIRNFTERVVNKILDRVGSEFNVSDIEDFIAIRINDFLNYSEGNDVTEWAAELVNTIRSSSFIYDSIKHPSSVSLPVELEEDENVKIYYLHDENKMDEGPAAKDKPSIIVLSKESGVWDGPDLDRSKILKKAAANLFIDHLDLHRLINIIRGKIKVKAALFYGDEEIASSEKELDRNSILDLLQKPEDPMIFTFELSNETEITYGTHLSLRVTVSSGTKFGLRLFRNVKLLYDSYDYPSSLRVEFDETDHIKIDVDQPYKIVALGGSVEYTLNVTSDFDDDIEIIVYGFSSGEKGKWNIEIVPESFSIDENGQETVSIIITSTDNDLDAYDVGDFLDVTFAATGKTGRDMFDAIVEISENAVEYDVVVTVEPAGQEVRHGEIGYYNLTIENINTGFWPDDYTIEALSEHDWDINAFYDEEELEDVPAGDKVEIVVTLSVPKYTDISSDLLTFIVTSGESGKSVTVNVTTTVIGPTILESIYGFFESAAEGLGLDEILGQYAAPFLIFILLFLVVFFVVLLIYFIKRKFVVVDCLDRIKEISPDEEAKFEVTIQNPTKKVRNYEISSHEKPMSPKWDTSLDQRECILEPGQSKTVVLTVKPTDLVQSDDCIEVDVVVNIAGKQKLDGITTLTMIKDSKVELKITGVLHWPKVFKKGDRVTTSFKLENKGNVSASNVIVILYVNGVEKNKVEDITIPGGGYADIEMPWIAVKGKNEINIVVR